MPKGKQSQPTALLVLSDPQICTTGANLKKLQKAAIAQLKQIRQLESESALRAVFVGFAFHRIKGSLKHGQFLPWIKANADSTGYRQANYYMRLAIAFIEHGHLSRKELLALPANAKGVSLSASSGPLADFITKAEKFVGGKSLNELLDEYGIKDAGKLGGARAKSPAEIDAPADAEQLYLFARDEIGGVILQAESLLLKENRLQHLSGHPEEIAGVVISLRELADKVEAAAKPFLKK